MLLRFSLVRQHQRTYAATVLVFLLPSLALPATDAEIIWNQQRFASFVLFQDASQSATTTSILVPMHLQASQNCAFETNQTNVSSLDTMQSPSLGLAAIVSWDEAVAAGCYSYAQFIQNLHEAGVDSELDIREVIFGSAIDNDAVLFGSPIVEPYGDIGHTDSGLSMTLTSASTARLLLADILQSTVNNATLQIVQELGPWNILAQATGFKAQKYTFLAVSIILILYTFWEIGLMLCTLTVWNRRMLMYLSAIGYLVVFALLHPYNINSRNSQMTIYVFWIIGYLSFTLFIISWGSMVEKIHTRAVVILMHHRKIHYGAAVLVSLSILLKLWAYAAESYQFSSIADSIVKYELPVVLTVQTVLLCFLIVSFLRRTFGIAISGHTKSVLRNVAVLCVVSLLGCLCMVALGILLLTPACFSTQGYYSIVILYSLGQCMLFVAIFGALWVRDHAKRTRPLFNRHEFYVDIDAQHQMHTNAAANPRPRSAGISRVDSAISIEDEPAHQLSILASQRYQFAQQNVDCNSDIRPVTRISTPIHNGSISSAESSGNCRSSQRSVIRDSHNSAATDRAVPVLQTGIQRKFSQMHTYVPLEPASSKMMQHSHF